MLGEEAKTPVELLILVGSTLCLVTEAKIEQEPAAVTLEGEAEAEVEEVEAVVATETEHAARVSPHLQSANKIPQQRFRLESLVGASLVVA